MTRWRASTLECLIYDLIGGGVFLLMLAWAGAVLAWELLCEGVLFVQLWLWRRSH